MVGKAHRFHYFIVLSYRIVCLGAAAAGTGLSWTSPVLDQLKAEGSTLPITNEEGTWIASSLAIGIDEKNLFNIHNL